MNEIETAADIFGRQYNCAQAVLAAFGPSEGLDRDACLALAAPFGAGICKRAEICGAVTGALMVLGLRHGKITVDAPEKKRLVYEIGAEFNRRFEERNGSVICRDLLGCDIGTPEGMQAAKDSDFHNTRCRQLVRAAAAIVTEMRGDWEHLVEHQI